MPIVKRAPRLRFGKMPIFIQYHIGKVFLINGKSNNNHLIAAVYRKKKHVKTVNITFSKLIKLDNRQWEVNFRKLPSMPYQFHADTATLQGERIQFNIYRDGTSGWKISGRDLPLLFTDQCEKLGVAIEKGLEEYYPGYAE